MVAANDFRAVRGGLDARAVDLDGRVRPMRDLALDAVADARSGLAGLEDDEPLQALGASLWAEPEPQRQRRIHAEHGMRGLICDLVTRTAASATPPSRVQRHAVL